MMIEALSIPHSIHIIESTSKETWFHAVNPFKMVPAMEDCDVYTLADGSKTRLNVFDSSACLTYLADKYDTEGLYRGRDLYERTVVMNWLMSYTAGLGATGKWWLLLKIPRPIEIADAMQVFVNSIKSEYGFLERRLSEPGQQFIALPDRATIADLATLPLANEEIAATAGIDFKEWPNLLKWSETVAALPPVARAMYRVRTFGLSEEELAERGLTNPPA